MEETYYAGAMPEEKRRFVKGLAIVVLLLALAGVAWWIADRRAGENEIAKGTEYRKNLPTLSVESRGKIPYGFPVYYVFGVKTQVVSGNLVEDAAAKTATRTVKFYSESFPSEVVSEYKEFFTGSGWTIVNENSAGDTATITAKDSEGSLAVSVISSGRGSMATLTYVTAIR